MLLDGLERYRVRSFADLGACWGVNGGNSYLALMTGRIERGSLVDSVVTDLTRHRMALYPQIDCITGEIGDPATAAQIGQVDAIILYDVLVHQARPDWDEIIDLYAPRARCFIVYNQQ